MPTPDPPKEHQWQPGQSGNPAGKPKGTKSLKTNLRELMEREIEIIDPISKKTEKKKISEVINLKLIANAMKGDQRAIDSIHDRLEGKPNQSIDIDQTTRTPDGITVKIVRTNRKSGDRGDDSPREESGGDAESGS